MKMADRIGQQLGNYRLVRLLGQGGFAEVYLGEHLQLGTHAAIKLLHIRIASEDVEIFRREARTIAHLMHPHIVRVLDFAVEDSTAFLVMEYAPGGPLCQRHPKGIRLSLETIVPYVQQVASALQYAHAQRLVHRDVKPENMLLGSHDEVLLSDFGLALFAPQTLSSGGTESMEQSLAGTTPYLAPEQLRGQAQPASDQYALGVVVYEWLCGKPPFGGAFLEVAVQHVSVPPPSLREQVPNLSAAIEEVVLRALAKEPELRFACVQDFATALEHASKPAVSPRFTPVLAPEHGAETGQRRWGMSDRAGQQLGNYRLLRVLGRGSFADVYVGEHLHLDMQAAIKVLHAHLTSEDSERLRTEARLLGRLVHPHIVRILDFDVKGGIPFLVMEYAPNGTLRQRHPKGTLIPLDTIVSYVKQLADALHYLHEQGWVHRDVKPGNMLFGRNDEILLTDYGFAITAQSLPSQQSQQMPGTIAYLASEQLQGHPDPASDQYALGIAVYEWLSGDCPFSGSFQEVASQHLSTPPPSLHTRVPTISPAIEQVVLKALAKDPQQRFASVQAFALALEEASKAESSGQTLLIPSSEHPAEAERNSSSMRNLPKGTVTLLFTDMEGSTHLLQQLGERYASVLTECRHLLRAAFQEWSGHEVDTQGDSFFVAFARATDAVSAAVDAQRALSSHPWPEGTMVRIRMGLHTGEPALTSEGYVGLDVHRAARIMSAGHGGQTLLSQTTSNLVEQDLPDDVSLRDLGEHRLKDLGHPKRLFQLVISDLPADFPPLRTLDTHPNNLPVQLTPFIGREQEVTAVQQLLLREDVRLLTLTGPGGTGKTRLSLQVTAELTDHFTDGVFFVNLAPISDPALVVPTIVQTLDIREVAGQPLLGRLKEDLQQKRMLLLLDNFEQVVSAAVQVVDLLVVCPRLKVLVTSREVLHVRAEREFPVLPLALPDPKRLPDLATLSHYAAVALFLQRAQAIKPDFQLTTTNARAITEICVRLDGLPLAIELAAARMKLLSPQALLARLSQRLAVLTSASQDVPARQQTLRNTIEWSYNLLDASDQQLFRKLSVFVGGCTLDAIEAVRTALDAGVEQVMDGVNSLLDKSLVQQTDQEGEEPRLLMLETIREYGLGTLLASGEMGATRHAHGMYYLALAEGAEPELAGPQQIVWLERLEREYDNLRAALQWSLEQGEAGEGMEKALRFGGALLHFWNVRGPWSEGRDFLERALARSGGISAAVRAKALIAAGYLTQYQPSGVGRAEELYKESLTLFQELGDRKGIAATLLYLGQIALDRGDYAKSDALYEESLKIRRELGDREGIAATLMNLGNTLFFVRGNYARSQALYEESLEILRDLNDKKSVASILSIVADIESFQGDYIRAWGLAQESLEIFKELGDRGGISGSFNILGRIALYQGDDTVARSLLEEGLARYKEMDDKEGIAVSLYSLGRLAFGQGDFEAARILYQDSLTPPLSGNRWFITLCLEGLASAIAAQGEPTWATQLWGAAESLRNTIYGPMPMPPVERTLYERSVAAVRTQLGEKSFAAAWAEGRSMTPEQTLAAQGPTTMPTPAVTAPASILLARKAARYPAGLTVREVEVLRLVAQGLTDVQVAEHLVISPRTVNTHLTSIYGKIQVSSRSRATRYAIEHQLV